MENKHIKTFENFSLNEEVLPKRTRKDIKEWNKKNDIDSEVNELFNTIKESFDPKNFRYKKFRDDNLIEIIYIDTDKNIKFRLLGPIIGLGTNTLTTRFISIDGKKIDNGFYKYSTFVKIFTYFRMKMLLNK